MGDIITGPGKYRPAGLVHPVRVKGGDDKLVFGYLADEAPCMAGLWEVETGKNLCPGNSAYDITGPWVDPPPKRHECWVNVYPCGRNSTYETREDAEKWGAVNPGSIGPARHMVELREGEVIVPTQPTEAMRMAGHGQDTSIGAYRAMIAARPQL
jgi:hypothetical protein